jgi:hypothetical protein
MAVERASVYKRTTYLRHMNCHPIGCGKKAIVCAHARSPGGDVSSSFGTAAQPATTSLQDDDDELVEHITRGVKVNQPSRTEAADSPPRQKRD